MKILSAFLRDALAATVSYIAKISIARLSRVTFGSSSSADMNQLLRLLADSLHENVIGGHSWQA